MNKLLLALYFSLLVLIRPVETQTTYHAYLPWFGNEKNQCGTEIWRGIFYEKQVEFLGCQYVRYNPGTTSLPNLYRTWKMNNKNWNSLSFLTTDLNKLRNINTIPIVVFYGNGQGTCSKVPTNEFQEYADFVKQAVQLFKLTHIEIWNEGDFQGGLANLYGCWGPQYITEYVNFLGTVTKTVWEAHPKTIIGSSFMTDIKSQLPMVQQVAIKFKNESRFYIGIHHYEFYGGTKQWTLSQKITDIRSFWRGELWLTETNMLKGHPTGHCVSPTLDFKKAQANYIASLGNYALDHYFIYGMDKYTGSWQCASLLEDTLKPSLGYKKLQPVLYPYP